MTEKLLPIENLIFNIATPRNLYAYTKNLLQISESRLHQFAKGVKLNHKDQNLYENYGYHPDNHYDHAYEELFEFTDDELSEEGLTSDQLQSYAVCERQQLMRAYLDEDNNPDDMRNHFFLLTDQFHQTLITELTTRLGPPESGPNYVSYWGPQYQDEIDSEHGWKVPLAHPLTENSDTPTHQWITIYKSTGGSGGDNFFSIWLMVSPSKESIDLALKLKDTHSKNISNQIPQER